MTDDNSQLLKGIGCLLTILVVLLLIVTCTVGIEVALGCLTIIALPLGCYWVAWRLCMGRW